jgi:hypothetical protein
MSSYSERLITKFFVFDGKCELIHDASQSVPRCLSVTELGTEYTIEPFVKVQ